MLNMPKKKKAAKKSVKKKAPAKKKAAKRKPARKRVAKVLPKVESKPEVGDRLLALIAYFWILFIIPLLVKRDNRFVHFHAKQGLVLFLVSIALSLFSAIPLFGWFIGPVLWVVLFVFWIVAVVQCLLGNAWKMPLIGDWAEMLNI
jgi:uncharacterized membrane protein